MLENIKGAIKNGPSRQTGNIGYTRQRKTKQKHNAICVGQINKDILLGCSSTFYLIFICCLLVMVLVEQERF